MNTERIDRLEVARIKLEAVLRYAEDALVEVNAMIEEMSLEDSKMDAFLEEQSK